MSNPKILRDAMQDLRTGSYDRNCGEQETVISSKGGTVIKLTETDAKHDGFDTIEVTRQGETATFRWNDVKPGLFKELSDFVDNKCSAPVEIKVSLGRKPYPDHSSSAVKTVSNSNYSSFNDLMEDYRGVFTRARTTLEAASGERDHASSSTIRGYTARGIRVMISDLRERVDGNPSLTGAERTRLSGALDRLDGAVDTWVDLGVFSARLGRDI